MITKEKQNEMTATLDSIKARDPADICKTFHRSSHAYNDIDL